MYSLICNDNIGSQAAGVIFGIPLALLGLIEGVFRAGISAGAYGLSCLNNNELGSVEEQEESQALSQYQARYSEKQFHGTFYSINAAFYLLANTITLGSHAFALRHSVENLTNYKKDYENGLNFESAAIEVADNL